MTEYEASCLGKHRFPSRRTARRRARQIRGEGGPRFHTYRCRYCHGVHVGHAPGHATYLRTGPHGPTHIQEYAT
ncbi:hypothetical protein [Streptomyces californicus]|uniref:hypothetical protein n=1 Tax=Streptomyces californicus TaxID=67351 RepID=UPI000B229155|nr:hypothetical protein [Streptomyces californicus]QRV59421.1 hypothetical protein I6J40_34750 [Streptomyces californicus]